MRNPFIFNRIRIGSHYYFEVHGNLNVDSQTFTKWTLGQNRDTVRGASQATGGNVA